VEWIPVSGRGRIYSYTVVPRPLLPEFRDQVPYAPAVVELEDVPEVRIVSDVVDAEPAGIQVGAPVSVVWEDVRPGLSLPRFVISRREG
jgi:uncharacterized protein